MYEKNWLNTLIEWYEANRRAMPWRDNPTPYGILVSEVMLQQTQIATVIPYFHRFMHAFPDLASLAEAPEAQVLKLWEGLGYYSRARHLQACAREIMARGGVFPQDYDDLKTLTGVGSYTSAAIASMAFEQKVAVVDGNVLRVRSRMLADEEPVDSSRLRKRYFKELTEAMQVVDKPGTFNQAMMELGEMVCRPREALCGQCPLADWCTAHQRQCELDYPKKTPRKKTPHYEVAVGLVYRKDKLLILRRSEEQMLGGLWEFPGGKLEEGETAEEACAREIREETGLEAVVGEEIAVINHAYSHFRITMHAFRCEWDGALTAVACERPWVWIREDEISQYAFPKANHKIFEKLAGR